MGRVLRVLPVTLILLVFALPTAAAEQVSDPNDVAGKLDLETLTGTRDSNDLLTLTLTTFGDWSAGVLDNSGHNRIFILFNTDADAKTDYTGTVYAYGSKLTVHFEGSGQSFENLPVKHPNGHTIKMFVPMDVFVGATDPIEIATRSRFKSSGKCSTPCVDRLPDSGWMTVDPA